MPDLGICQAQKKAPPKQGQFAQQGGRQWPQYAGEQLFASSIFEHVRFARPDLRLGSFRFRTCSFAPENEKKTNMPRPRGRGFWAHYSPLVPILGFVGVIRERDQVVWLVFGCDIDHATLGFFHDFA